MKLIVGLGNPGRDYQNTRHNAGFMAVDRLARRHNLTGARSKFHAGVLEGHLAGEKVMLMQPLTYMNRSGLAVGEAARFHKIEPTDVLILVDDIALSIGTIRIRPKGGAGGHNGLSDIQRALGTDAYPRLRIGIDPPMIDGHRISQHDYVLGTFTEQQQAELEPALTLAAEATETWIAEGIDAAMNRFNTKDKPEPAPESETD
jgi:PTH1 family peptidyl-tRNA hydrolase